MTKHIFHDTDRDGWGSAALMLAELGPERCILHPQRGKELAFDSPKLASGAEHVYVLDLPAPMDWDRIGVLPCPVTWADHHLASWHSCPAWVRAVLPPDDRPTTTMTTLIRSGVVTHQGWMRFVRSLCRRSPPFDWGLVFDGMRDETPNVPNLHSLLALGPLGEPAPEALRFLIARSDRIANEVDALLDTAPTTRIGNVIRIDLADARGVPLARYSLAAERRFPGHVRVLVHRGRLLYVGRDSGDREGVDLVAHFRNRGLEPKGHPYVCYVNVASTRIDAEIDALVRVVEKGS